MGSTWNREDLPYDAMGDYSMFHFEGSKVQFQILPGKEEICADQDRKTDRNTNTSFSVPCISLER